jgi:outer membrane scaffolding protein for murein synthesis (MipA/OmpV family)
VLLWAVFSITSVHAGSATGRNTESAAQDKTVWIVTLGGGTEYGPSYEGASNLSFSFVPYFDIRRFGEPPDLSPPDDNIDYSLIKWGALELGPVAGYRGSRSTSDDSALEGLHDIDWSVDAGIFAQYWVIPDRFRLRVEGRQALRENYGFVADFFADVFQPVGSKIILSAGPRLSLADTSYMRNNFGITPQEAADNGSLAPFDIGGGLKSIGFVVSASYQFTDTMTLQVYDKYDRLVGDAADSPIVTDIGSADQNTIGITLRRSFEISF